MCSWCFSPVGCPKGIYHYWLELVLSRALKQVEVVACLKLGCSKVIFTPHRPICSGSPWILENPIGQRTILNSPLKWISGLIMSLWFPGIRFLRFFLSFLGLLAWDLRTAPMFIPKAPVDPLGTKLSRPCFSRGRSAFQVREGTPPDTSYPTKGQPSISTLLDSASLDFPAWMCCRPRVGCGNFAPGRKKRPHQRQKTAPRLGGRSLGRSRQPMCNPASHPRSFGRATAKPQRDSPWVNSSTLPTPGSFWGRGAAVLRHLPGWHEGALFPAQHRGEKVNPSVSRAKNQSRLQA